VKLMVETPEDLKILTYAVERKRFRERYDNWRNIEAAGGDIGLGFPAFGYTGLGSLRSYYMGVQNTIYALYDEPEECKALLDYLCNFYLTIAEKMIDYVKPDIMAIVDDTATANAPFMSPDMFKEFFLPLYDRQAKFGRDRGLPISYHNCGKCETLLEPMVNIGVSVWDPAQPMNDLDAIKKKYGNRLVIAGGWQPRGRLLESDVSDEEIEESVREVIYRLAPGGGYCFFGGYMGLTGDEESARRNRVVQNAYMRYRAKVYGN